MRFSFQASAAPSPQRQPLPACIPKRPGMQFAAIYRGARVGGDFFDILEVGESKILFVLLDIAGRRDNAFHVAAVVQQLFREKGTEMFSASGRDDNDVITDLLLDMNRSVISTAGGVCFAPAFIACYDLSIHMLTYINAGHSPGLMRDDQGLLPLEANGLPLGLFSHATHDAQYCGLTPGAGVVLASRGLLEARSGGREFGLDRFIETVRKQPFDNAQNICKALLESTEEFQRGEGHFGPSLRIPGLLSGERNDMTALAFIRTPE